jgi:AAA domain
VEVPSHRDLDRDQVRDLQSLPWAGAQHRQAPRRAGGLPASGVAQSLDDYYTGAGEASGRWAGIGAERTVAVVLASPHIIAVGDGNDRWTSSDLVDVERRLLNAATSSRGSRPSIDPTTTASIMTGLPTIGDDQRAAVVRLTESTDAVSVLVGPVGTGKTFTLDAVRAVNESAGSRVIGAAPSARAAHELEAGAHIPSMTIHRLFGSWSRGFDLPDPNTVLVIDESAMAGTRDLEAVMTATVRAGARVVLVGDHHQLPEVTAGGGFAALAEGRMVTVAELTVNRRQDKEWERAALGELRDGHVVAAVAAYREHGRVDITTDRTTMLTSAVDQWVAATVVERLGRCGEP